MSLLLEALKVLSKLLLSELKVKLERELDVFDKTLELTKILLILFSFNKYLIAFISPETSNLYYGIWESIPTFPILLLKTFVPDVVHLEEFIDAATDNLPFPSKFNEASYKSDRVSFTRLNGV